MKERKEREKKNEQSGGRQGRNLSLSPNLETLEITEAKLLRACDEQPRKTVAVGWLGCTVPTL